MTKEEKMEYIIRHYKLMTAKEIATKLGMSQWMVYDYIKQSGLRNKNREVYERGEKRKYDTSKNPDVEIPQDDPGKSRMVRVTVTPISWCALARTPMSGRSDSSD